MIQITSEVIGFDTIEVESTDMPEKKQYACKINVGYMDGENFVKVLVKRKGYADVLPEDVPAKLYEKIVADGGSTDYTDLMTELSTKTIEEVISELGMPAILAL